MIKKYLSGIRYIKLLFVFIIVCLYKIWEYLDIFLIFLVKDFGKYEYNIIVFFIYNFFVIYFLFVR